MDHFHIFLPRSHDPHQRRNITTHTPCCHSYKLFIRWKSEAGSQQVFCSRQSHPWGGSIKGKQGSSSTVSGEKHSGASHASWAVSKDTSPVVICRPGFCCFTFSRGEKDEVNIKTVTEPWCWCFKLSLSKLYCSCSFLSQAALLLINPFLNYSK